jgi:MFS superfamily sulfate permease-like transporter
MKDFLQPICLIIVVLAMVPALAHALELPGKLRLGRDAYFAVQPIYYPGFTIAGLAEPVAIVLCIVLLVVTPRATAEFWWSLAALVALLAMHAVYWLFTHPVNRFWLRGEKVGGAGRRFFSAGASMGSEDWKMLRDRWEYSHVARATLAFFSFIALVLARSQALFS